MAQATPDTIVTALEHRITLYRTRYGKPPTDLPLTLDEWAWLSEWMAYARALVNGHAPLLNVPLRFQGILLRLVEQVYERPDGSLVVKP